MGEKGDSPARANNIVNHLTADYGVKENKKTVSTSSLQLIMTRKVYTKIRLYSNVTIIIEQGEK